MATQVEIGKHLDMSDRQVREVLKHLKLDHRSTSLDRVRIAYIRDLREKAAGRTVNEARERRDMAAARESEINAELKERELHRQDGLILDFDSVRQAMMGWSATAKNEFISAVNDVITAIESAYGISVERQPLQPDIEAALRTIGSYAFESETADSGDSAGMVAAT